MPVTLLNKGDYAFEDAALIQTVESFLVREGFQDQQVNLLVVDSKQMKRLNRDYHGIDEPTDVLSFPYMDPQSSQDVGVFVVSDDEPLPLGEIVLCYPYAQSQAKEKGVSVQKQLEFLVEHGMEHLMGRHHE